MGNSVKTYFVVT